MSWQNVLQHVNRPSLQSFREDSVIGVTERLNTNVPGLKRSLQNFGHYITHIDRSHQRLLMDTTLHSLAKLNWKRNRKLYAGILLILLCDMKSTSLTNWPANWIVLRTSGKDWHWQKVNSAILHLLTCFLFLLFVWIFGLFCYFFVHACICFCLLFACLAVWLGVSLSMFTN